MAMEENAMEAVAPGRTAYGRVFRERGTLRLVMTAVALGVVWYVYSYIQTERMKQVHWPPLQPVPNGLTVLGLRDKDRPGWHHKYVAIESNHAWQIHRPDEDEESEGSAGSGDS